MHMCDFKIAEYNLLEVTLFARTRFIFFKSNNNNKVKNDFK